MNGLTCIVITLVFTPALGLNMQANMQVSEVSSLHLDAESAKTRPVSKVITLLKDMLKQLEKEGEGDEETYDKTACWCVTNDKDKSESIGVAQTRVSGLTTKIEELTASSARLTTEISNLNTEVAENQGGLDKATSIRQKQLSEFNVEEKDLLGSISSLKAAITVLSKKGSSFLQVPTSHVDFIAAAVQKHALLLTGVLTHSQRKAVTAFIQAPTYAPQGSEIFGILSQMKETFSNNLASSQKDEATNQKAFEDLKAAKETQISSGQAQVDTKTQELADSEEKNAASEQDLENTNDSLAADQAFLSSLKEKCTLTDSEWEERQKTRNAETEAVSKALAVLSSDDAHDLFTKTFNFLQTEKHSARRSEASKLLSGAAKKFQNPRLATLAVRVRLSAFTEVKKQIDGMVVDLLKEKDDESKLKDFCFDEFNTDQAATSKKTHSKSDTSAKISDLEGTISALTSAISGLNAEVTEMQTQLKNAVEDRAKEKKDFQMTVADQRATQKLLAAALQILKGYYAKTAAALVQAQAEPAGFGAMNNNAASAGVMDMLQQIITDAKAMEVEAVHSEANGVKAYEAFAKNTNASINAKNSDTINKKEAKAKADSNLIEAKENKDAVMLELEQLANENAELHKTCDFVTKNFDLRQTARDEEVEALNQAKAIISGANFAAFLQKV